MCSRPSSGYATASPSLKARERWFGRAILLHLPQIVPSLSMARSSARWSRCSFMSPASGTLPWIGSDMIYEYVAIPESEIPEAGEALFQHVVDTYASESNKVISIWRGFEDGDL